MEEGLLEEICPHGVEPAISKQGVDIACSFVWLIDCLLDWLNKAG